MGIVLRVDGKDASNGWISLDPKSRRLQALTWDSPQSESQFSLVATDSGNNQKQVPVRVMLNDNSNEVSQTNLITLTISAKYSIFVNSIKNQVELYKKIQQLFPNSVVTLKSVKQGSVVASFSLRNSDGPDILDSCPTDELESYKSILFEGKGVKKAVVKHLGSYRLSKVDFLPVDLCEDAVTPQSALVNDAVITTDEPEPESNLTLIIIIVVVVVVIIVIIVIIVVCVKKRNAAKAKGARQNGNDIEKRVPVVMDEEMKSLTRAENEPLMDSTDVSYKPTPAPPAYHGEKDYQPDTPPVSEPDDERRILDRSP